MQNQIPEFAHGVYGAYMIKHMASNKVYVSYGELAYVLRYEFFMLLLGIHPNKELQSLYQDNNDICFIPYTAFKSLEESAEYGQRLFDFFWSTKRLTNVGEEIQQVNCFHSNTYVGSIYDISKFSTEVYNNFCVYTVYNPYTKVFYVGSGDRDTREYRHFNDLEKNKHGNRKLQKAYCEDNRFEFFWVPVPSRKEAYAFEQNLIDHFWGKQGFLNLSSLVCVSDGMKGQKHTEETKTKISEKAREHWSNPKRREDLSIRSIEWWSRLTEDDRVKFLEKKSLATSESWKNEEYRQAATEGMKKAWTEERRTELGLISKARMNQPDLKAKYSETAKNNWEDPIYREAVTSGIKRYANQEHVRKARSKVAKEYSNRPEVKAARSSAAKQRFENPKYKNDNASRMKTYNVERSKGVNVDGVVYSSLREASKVTGISRAAVKKKINKGIYILV
jgi:hypothetical protein